MERVGTGEQVGDQGVPGLVIGDGLLLRLGDDHGAPLHAHQDLVLGVLEVEHLDDLLVLASRQQRRLVHQIRQIRSRKARGAARQHLQLHVGSQRDAPRVHFQDLFPTLHIGPGHDHLAVEATRAQESGVEHIGPVGGGHHDHVGVGVEAVHLDQDLVESLLTLVVRSAQAGAALASDGVDLVDEHDARRVALGLLEQVTHPAGADAHEHLDEFGAGDAEEGHASLAGHSAGQQRLAGAGRADEQHAARDASAE